MSKIITSTLYSSDLHIDWNYDLYISTEHVTNKKYNLIIMLHGLYGNHSNFLDTNRINSKDMLDKINKNPNKPILVAFVDGFNSFYIDSTLGMKMESAVIKELIPYLKTKFDLNDQISIGGISMGGFGASRFALKYPTLFNQVMIISPAIWKMNDIPHSIYKSIHAFQNKETNWSTDVYQKNSPISFLDKNTKKVNFFIESSLQDSIVPINSVNYFANKVRENGNNVLVNIDELGEHNWKYWQKAIKNGYKWLINNLREM